jgi:hypothetical protein
MIFFPKNQVSYPGDIADLLLIFAHSAGAL